MPDGHIDTNILTPETTADETQRKRKRKYLLLGLAGVVKVGLLAGGAYWELVASHHISTDNAYVGAANAQISPQVSGAIADVRVDNTQTVRRGDILATIDPADAHLTVAKAEADYARALQRVSQYFAQESAAAAQVRAREADFARAKADYDRRKGLGETGAVSAEEVSTTRAIFEAARANLNAAEQSLQSARALTQGSTVNAHPETNAAHAVLQAAQLDLARTVIVAPIDGVVAQRNVQVGQRVAPGQALMTVTPIAEAYVDANFKENQLSDVKIGQAVKLSSDLYGDDVTYHGRVTGLAGGTGAAFAVIPAQNATGNWIKVVQRVPVRIALDTAELRERPLRVGLSMTATIDTRKN